MPKKGDLLNIGLFLLECVFEKSHKTTLLTKIHRVLVFIGVSTIGTFTIINLFRTKNELLVRTMETFITEYHLSTKYILYLINKEMLEEFLDALETRWSLDIAEPKLRATIDKIYKLMWNFLITLRATAFLTVFTFFLQPIHSENPMVLEIWLPTDNPIITAILWIMQSHTLIVALLFIIGSDAIFVAMCVHMYVQLLLLQQEYGKLILPINASREEEIESRRKLKICVTYHQFLLRLFAGMRKVYSPLYLAQFFSTLISACMELFILSTNTESIDIAEVINKFLYVLTILLQFALYCFPAEYLTEELKNLADAVYASKWYESKPAFRRELAMIMAASLKQSAFTAGGFSDVRMSTFTSVVKLSFSFFTFSRRMVGK